MADILLWLLVIGLFGLGLTGIFLPGIPGIGLVFGGVVLYAATTDFATISVPTVAILGVVTLVAWLADYLGALLGAKVGGGGLVALGGMLFGGLVGVVTGGPAGLLLGLFLGALAGALYEGRSVRHASVVALLAVVGMVGATVFQALVAVGMIATFALALVF